ncbi:uncharacterized protein LOC121386128 [Gigantopelta aegis]|uniref:uncharacterized protein LOC121386128 n=1 Tax=Gigantopelta aegis TaxID=1735272 RepID=UPI001B88B850|nr:uncharacterized protein LOC121386128 [Gigantopelta aegis]
MDILKSTQSDWTLKRVRTEVSDSSSSEEESTSSTLTANKSKVISSAIWPIFLVIESTINGALKQLSPFAVEKGLQGLAVEPKSVKKETILRTLESAQDGNWRNGYNRLELKDVCRFLKPESWWRPSQLLQLGNPMLQQLRSLLQTVNMKLTVAAVGIVAFVFSVLPVSDVADASINCMGGAYSGQNTTLVCNLMAQGLDGMRWIRPTNEEVMACAINNTLCVPDTRTPGYSFVIDSPSQVTLIIESFNFSTDAGQWICQDGMYGTGRSVCNKTQFFALTNVAISTKPPMIMVGVSTVLRCVTNPTFPTATIMWILDNTHITQGVTTTTERVPGSGFITTSNLTKTYASEDDGKMLVCSATNGEYTVTSAALEVSTGDPELMSALRTGATTGIVIAVVLALAIPIVGILYKRNKRQPDAVEENIDNRTQKSEIERSQIDNPVFTQTD